MKFQIILIAFLSFVFIQCKSSQNAKENITIEKEMKLETNTEITASQIYFQKWVGGLEETGSGINIFFPNLINKNNFTLKQVYFRGMIGDIKSGKASYFSNLKKQKQDLIMTNKENGEYGNTMPNNTIDFPFELKDNECVISYLDNGETKYIKLDNIEEKEAQYYPSAPPRNNKE